MNAIKIVAIATLLSIISCGAFSQIVRVDNAKYFDSEHNLYNGTYQENYENGNVRIKMNISDGELDSTTILYFEDGKINEVRTYKKGLMHGLWETYNATGFKVAEARYRNDKKDGEWKIWDNNGTLRYQMFYSNGIKIGVWKIFDETGNVLSEKNYTE